MNIKRTTLSFIFLTIVAIPFLMKIPMVRALTAEEISNQIAEIQAIIRGLQQSQEESVTEVWCHDFGVSLKYGDTGAEVEALQMALEEEGFFIPNSEKLIGAYFGPNTASGVVGFQEKYYSEILEDRGLNYGTGFVGEITRNKLNEIYGCGAVTRLSLELTSPNGGEVWEPEEKYTIAWESKNVDYVVIKMINDENICTITEQPIKASVQSYTYNLSNDHCVLSTSDKMKIQISQKDELISDISDEYFSISSAETSCGDNVCSAEETFESCVQDCGYKLNPYDADVDVCSDDNGTIYSSTGQKSANWFVKNCAQRKYYEVNPDQQIVLIAKTDEKDCHYPKFYIHEEENGKWKYQEYFDLFDLKNYTQISYYTPKTDKIRIHAPKCFYLDIYTKNPVIEKTLTLVSPDGSKEWNEESVYDITWRATGIETINIYATVNGNSKGAIASGIEASSGKYSWKIPTYFVSIFGIARSENVSLTITDSTNSKIYDTTDKSFTIISKEGTCHLHRLWAWDYCSANCPCEIGEGDCGEPEDCKSGYCAQNVGTKYDQHYSMDVCEAKPEPEPEPELETEEPSSEEYPEEPLGLPDETTPESPVEE
ncbi:MAG: hypothetical protein ABH967_00820 [Patescibacteria group bacterium]